jgi:hypothetical protein
MDTDAVNKVLEIFTPCTEHVFDDVMSSGLWPIANLADIDKMALFRNSRGDDGLLMSQIYRWSKESGGSTEIIPSYSNVPYAQLIPGWEE